MRAESYFAECLFLGVDLYSSEYFVVVCSIQFVLWASGQMSVYFFIGVPIVSSGMLYFISGVCCSMLLSAGVAIPCLGVCVECCWSRMNIAYDIVARWGFFSLF